MLTSPSTKIVDQLDEESEFLHGNNQRVVFLAEMAFHELRCFPFHEFALGAIGAALGFRTLRGDFGSSTRRYGPMVGTDSTFDCLRPRAGASGTRGPWRVRIFQRPLQHAMNDQVRIAANGRSEMRVFLRGQREMAERIGARSAPVSANAASGKKGCALRACRRFFRRGAGNAAGEYRLHPPPGTVRLIWRMRP